MRSRMPLAARWLLALFAAIVPALAAAQDSPRPAERIIRDFRRVQMPSMSDGSSPEAVAKFEREINEGCRAQGRFANELLAGYPQHPELPGLMRIRWAGMNNALDESGAVLREAAAVIEGEPTPALARIAWTAMARAAVLIDGLSLSDRRDVVLRAAREATGDEDAGYQLLDFVRRHVTDPAEARELTDRVIREYGSTQWTAPEARTWRKHLDRIGAAHRESFPDFRTGEPFDTDAAKGPRIVHYWSPAADGVESEIRDIAALIERFGPRGLAVCGVHDGRSWLGDDGLAEWADEHHLTWPQRLALAPEGAKPWETGVSVPSVPCALLIDREGKIRMISERVGALVPMLEKMVSEEEGKGEAL